MTTFRVYAPRQMSDVQVPVWNGTIRGGDDLKIAFTLLHEDGETPLVVAGARARLALYPVERGAWSSPDYGLGTLTTCSRPVMTATGYVVNQLAGRLNFYLSGARTAELCTSVRAFIEVDLPDGVGTVVQGTIQVRQPVDGLAHINPVFFQIAVTPIGTGMLAGTTALNVPVDDDGFPLVDPASLVLGSGSSNDHGQPIDPTSAILGVGVLGQMIILSSGSAAVFGQTSSELNTGVLGQMVLAAG